MSFKWSDAFRASMSLKIMFLVFFGLLILKQLFILCNLFLNYLYIVDFLIWRLFFILCIIIVLQSFLNLPFVKGSRQEMSIFNEGPANKSFFIVHLRKYHFLLLMSAYLFYYLAVTYFVEDPVISYLLGLIVFINLILYLVQLVVYTKEYVAKSFKSNTSIFSEDKKNVLPRGMFTASNFKKIVPIFVEFFKVAVALIVLAEVGCKLIHGSMNYVPPWREHWLNQQFSDRESKRWTESEASAAFNNRAMGWPQDFHGSINDDASSSLNQQFPGDKDLKR